MLRFLLAWVMLLPADKAPWRYAGAVRSMHYVYKAARESAGEQTAVVIEEQGSIDPFIQENGLQREPSAKKEPLQSRIWIYSTPVPRDKTVEPVDIGEDGEFAAGGTKLFQPVFGRGSAAGPNDESYSVQGGPLAKRRSFWCRI